MIDREQVIAGLEHCITDDPCFRQKYITCPYTPRKTGDDCCARAFAKDVLTLLKEQEIVRCKDCRYWTSEKIHEYHICKRWEKAGVKNFATAGNWFCADGELKEGR